MSDLPVTAVEDPFLLDCNPFEEVLVLVGLGRPFAGNFQHILMAGRSVDNLACSTASLLDYFFES